MTSSSPPGRAACARFTSDQFARTGTAAGGTHRKSLTGVAQGYDASAATEHSSNELRSHNRKAAAAIRSVRPRYKVICGILVDHSLTQVITTLLTLYALFGDNIRLMATEKPHDPIFAFLTIACMVVFTIEITLSCIGKDGYVLGFFFWLDFVSTVSLVLDIPQVSEALFDSGSMDEEGGALRAGRAGRAGARAGRVVRVIRLIRIVKLYKAMQEAEARRKRKLAGGDDDDWLLDDMVNEDGKSASESRVGKKLTDMTIRRVIILVLAMLFVLPYLDAQGLTEMPTSGEYGTDLVHASFINYYKEGSSSNSEVRAFMKKKYESQLLQYVHFHNWFTQYEMVDCDGCSSSNDYKAHVFWLGLYGKARREAVRLANVDQTDIPKWGEVNIKDTDDYRLDPLLPDYAIQSISDPWDQVCTLYKTQWSGVSLSGGHDTGLHCPDELRYNERLMLGPGLQTPEEWKELAFIAFVDKRPFTRAEAMLDTIKILFICAVLCIGSMLFSKDANVLVLNPLEQMISKVEKIRDNPLYAMKLGDDEFRREEVHKQKAKQQQGTENGGRTLMQKWRKFWAGSKTGAEPMETVILEKTIIKIGTLLALGFGEAGANTIGQNMKGADTAGVNAMIPGSRIESILGYISIQHFSVATEVLQGAVMTFVNQIAEIVHGVTDEFHGAVNRNSGESFLLVWRTDLASLDDDDRERLGDLALVSFVKILSAVQRSPVLAEYRWHPGVLQRLRNYSVQLSFALHHGWAIEGAIGSEFKIDASYLSPNVGITMRLEAATKIYGVKILLSEAVISLMSQDMRLKCRLIDRVVVPGSAEPMKIWTVDLDYAVLPVDPPLCTDGLVWNQRRRFKARQILETRKKGNMRQDRSMVNELDMCDDVKAMRTRFTERFFQVFGMAYHNYVAGEWAIAHNMLSETTRVLGEQDGPSAALLDFMAETDFDPPHNWNGYRELPVPR